MSKSSRINCRWVSIYANLSQIQMTSTPCTHTQTHTYSSCAFDYCLLVTLSLCVFALFFCQFINAVFLFLVLSLKFSDVFFAKHLHTPLALVSCTYACVVTDCWRHQQCPSSWRNHKFASKYGCKWWANERERDRENVWRVNDWAARHREHSIFRARFWVEFGAHSRD